MKKKNYILLLITLLFLWIITACSSEEAVETEASERKNSASTEEFDPNDKSDWPKSIRVGSASVGGTAYIYAGGYADIIADITEVNTSVEVTGGPNHNIQLLENGDLEMGVVTMGPAWDGWYGEGDWTGGKEHREMRVFFPMYTNYSHFWADKSEGIDSIEDLNGIKVGVGPAGGTPGTYLPKFLELLEIDADPLHAGIGDLVSQQLDGLVPAVGFSGGVPFAAAVEAEAQRELNFFGFPEESVKKIVEKYPYFSEAVIPAGTYNTQTEDLSTVSVWNMGVVDKDISDSFVYQAVDAIFSNNERLVQAHIAGEETVPENIKYNTFVFMHPGAIRWFEDNGIELPEEVYPPEYPKE